MNRVFNVSTWSLFLLICSLFFGCSEVSETNDSAENENELSFEIGNGSSDLLFDSNTVIQVEITLDSSDWDFVRNQERDVWSQFAQEDCLNTPWDDPYEYRSGEISVNGVVIQNVGIRKKGFVGSVNAQKPSLKVKLDEYIDDQELNGLDRLTLNNNLSDESHLAQCITYSLFNKAGVPAPRCNFAQVTVNGTYLGLYSNIESIKKRFLAQHFSDNDGLLFEGTQSDFRDGWTGTFEQKTKKKAPDMSAIEAMIDVLATSDDSLVAALDRLVDIDAFLTFWGMEVLTNHTDGMSSDVNNYYFYIDPTSEKLFFIPWGADKTMISTGKFSDEGLLAFMNGIIPFRLYSNTTTRERFVEELQKLLTEVWNESEIIAEIDRMENLLEDSIKDEPEIDNAFGKKESSVSPFASAIKDMRTYVNARREAVNQSLAELPEKDKPMDLLCGDGNEGDKKDDSKNDEDKSCTEGEVYEEWSCVNGVWVGPKD
ncbi:MAG: CotH kinase family protein [Fibrobacterales bacterium]